MSETESEERANYLVRERAALERHVAECNARIEPEMPGFVRTTGSRRQYRMEIRGGELCAVEI